MAESKRHFLRSCVCCGEPAGVSRRGFLASAVGAGAVAATGLTTRRAAAQAKPSRITVFYQSVTISAGSVSYYRLIWRHRLTLKASFTAPWLTDRTPGWGRLTGH
jgi:hypothetical protein